MNFFVKCVSIGEEYIYSLLSVGLTYVYVNRLAHKVIC